MSQIALSVAFVGPPGCGKGRQGSRNAALYNLIHLNSGEELRMINEKKFHLGEIVNAMNAGELIPDELSTMLMEMRLIDHYLHKDNYLCERILISSTSLEDTDRNKPTTHLINIGELDRQQTSLKRNEYDIIRKNGIIFDGYPRTSKQFDRHEKLMQLLPIYAFDAIILLNVSDEECERRVERRGRTGEIAIFQTRMEEYHTKTKPMISLMEERYISIFHEVNGNGTKESTDMQVGEILAKLFALRAG